MPVNNWKKLKKNGRNVHNNDFCLSLYFFGIILFKVANDTCDFRRILISVSNSAMFFVSDL